MHTRSRAAAAPRADRRGQRAAQRRGTSCAPGRTASKRHARSGSALPFTVNGSTGQFPECLVHLGGGAYGTKCVVLMQDRDAKDRHDCVADELLDRAAVSLDDSAHLLEVARDDPTQRLGVKPVAQRRRAGHVAADDRDRLPHLRFYRRQWYSTGVAVAGAFRVLVSALRADNHGRRVGRWSPRFQVSACGPGRASSRGVERAGLHSARLVAIKSSRRDDPVMTRSIRRRRESSQSGRLGNGYPLRERDCLYSVARDAR
jgi:hypothetical protein